MSNLVFYFREVQASQRSVAIIAEMIHTASLVHDDVIDDANSRRGKMTVNQIWGERKVRMEGLHFSSGKAETSRLFAMLLSLGTLLGCSRKSVKHCVQIVGKTNGCSVSELLEALEKL